MNKKHFRLFGKKFMFWVIFGKYNVNKSGLWPIYFWLYDNGLGFHGLNIADCHLEWKD